MADGTVTPMACTHLHLPASDLQGRRVHAYRNLHHRDVIWSLRDPATGRGVAHVDAVTLGGVVLRVRAGGQARARRDQQRNVHAYVAGTVVTAPPDGLVWAAGSYNPITDDTFITDAGVPLRSARFVTLDGTGLRWAS